jgi:hypothetical protein
MSIDDLLFMIIIGGMALSIAYLRAQFALLHSYRIAEQGSELRLRELYATRRNVHAPLETSARPLSCAAVRKISPKAVLHRSPRVLIRFVSKSNPIARQ